MISGGGDHLVKQSPTLPPTSSRIPDAHVSQVLLPCFRTHSDGFGVVNLR